MRRLCAVLAILLLPAPVLAASPRCTQQVKALRSWMDQLISVPPAPVGDRTELVSLPAGPPATERMPLLTLSPQASDLDGFSVKGPITQAWLKQVGEKLEALRRNRSLLEGKDLPLEVALAISPRTPWSAVAQAASALAKQRVQRVVFLFAGPARLKPPPPSPLDKELAAVRKLSDPAQIAQELARIWEKLLLPCPPLAKAFAAVAGAEPTSKARLLAAGLSEGLPRCDCAASIPSLKAALWATLQSRPVIAHARRLGDSAALVLPGKEPWSKAYRRILATPLKAALQLKAR